MKFMKNKVNTFMYEAFCECGGQMIFTGKVFFSSPPQYEHRCPRCKKHERLKKKYPLLDIQYERTIGTQDKEPF